MIGGSSAPYLARTPCVPFVLRLTRLETKNVLDYQGRAGDHFHCTVEPSPGHIRCRFGQLPLRTSKISWGMDLEMRGVLEGGPEESHSRRGREGCAITEVSLEVGGGG